MTCISTPTTNDVTKSNEKKRLVQVQKRSLMTTFLKIELSEFLKYINRRNFTNTHRSLVLSFLQSKSLLFQEISFRLETF